MKHEDYSENLGSSYRVVSSSDGEVSLLLVETGVLKPPPEDAPDAVRRDPFYLVFQGRLSLDHETKPLELVGPDGVAFILSLNNEGYVDGDSEQGCQYYAVVN